MSDEGRLVAGRYRVQRRIGSGAMGVVWECIDERLHRTVAVKQLLLQPGLDPGEAEEARQRAMREGRIAARLQHQHAISVYDVAEDEGQPVLVMEYLPSTSLAAMMNEHGPLPPREVARIGAQVAAALGAAHSAGVVHRDIKPGNILLGDNGTVKITDFGISRAQGDVQVTKTGMLAGTPAYLSPDVAMGYEPTGASDVFSLGATLYAAIEGRPPFGLNENTLALLHADGAELDALSSLADGLRRDAVGDDVTFVVTRNINFTNVCYTGCRFCAFAQRRSDADAYTLSLSQVGERVDQAWEAGATEVCMQGGIHPDMPGTAYFDLAEEVKRRQPDMHLHSYSPMEVVNGASRTNLSIRDWLTRARESGVDSLPGTAAEILDDDVRWVLTKGKLPTSSWIEVISTAHELGIPTTSTMMYGHVDTPAHWVQHIKLIASLQRKALDNTGKPGFTEFVLLPFIHQNSPIYLAGLARAGTTPRENRAVHAMARILLHGLIDNIQCSWVKLGVDGCRDVLNGGVNDLGGTLMEETISRMAGADNGSYKTISDLEDI